MSQTLVRFFSGGIIVCAFAIIGDGLKPKSFAGLFGAAPSVALATLTVMSDGASYAANEGRSMMAGAIAFLFMCLSSVGSWCDTSAGPSWLSNPDAAVDISRHTEPDGESSGVVR
jgi:hypothetical protein